ncbi:MAG TPA: prenyltransferase, partial [Candidatus Dormibacteraeota bacterium]|nr:prenyltransferase [Candidatus Dormibacteraeota bacterium]
AAASGETEPLVRRIGRRMDAWWEIVRPFSFTASVLPVTAGAAVAFEQGRMNWWLFLVALVAGVALHVGTNVINEIYDVRLGVDSITSPRASQAILKGRVTEREAFAVAFSAFGLAVLLGVVLFLVRGLPIVGLGLLGLLAGYFYTAPPFQYKYRALGLPLVFLLMGPLMVVGSYYAITGGFDARLLVVSIPVGLLVTAILHGNEWRDITEDTRYGFSTLSSRVGRANAHWIYVMLVLGAYVAIGLGVMVDAVPKPALLTLLSLPLVAWVLRSAELGAAGNLRAIAKIDLMTARLHSAFGALLVVGLLAASSVR